jgi:hypothetical protein
MTGGAHTLDSVRFQGERTAEYLFDVPLAPLPPNEYLLTIEPPTAGTTVARALRFRVKPGV